MDGAGSLARSQRSPRPRTDLKAAAIGAAVLLREWFASRRRVVKPVVKPRFERAPQPRLIATIERYLPNRIGVAATVLILLGSAGFGVVKGGHLEELTAALSDTRNALANSAGFRITTVAINGRKQLTQDEVLGIGGVNGRSSLLFLDAATVRDKLKANPWIADATILKLYPGRLHIAITERDAFALWQRGGKVEVISEDGAVVESYAGEPFSKLPLVVGAGAETRAKSFLALLDQYPAIREKLSAAVLVAERRWNLALANGLEVQLPESGVEQALDLLVKLDRDDKILTRDITAIDLRLPDRVTVRLSDEAAAARAEALKGKTVKKKGGAA